MSFNYNEKSNPNYIVCIYQGYYFSIKILLGFIRQIIFYNSITRLLFCFIQMSLGVYDKLFSYSLNIWLTQPHGGDCIRYVSRS